jgi:hypothetical protein
VSGTVFLVPGKRPAEVEAAIGPVLAASGHRAVQARTEADRVGTLVILEGSAAVDVVPDLIAVAGGIVAAPPIGPGAGAAGSAGAAEEEPATAVVGAIAHTNRDLDDGTVRVSRAPRLRLPDGTVVPVRGRVLLGRDPQPRSSADRSADLVAVDDPGRSVSKTHVALDLRGGQLVVEDLGSTNGTFVVDPDGRRHAVLPGSPVEVRAGDSVLLGDVTAAVIP